MSGNGTKGLEAGSLPRAVLSGHGERAFVRTALRQHASADEMEAQGPQTVAMMGGIVGDKDDDHSRRWRR